MSTYFEVDTMLSTIADTNKIGSPDAYEHTLNGDTLCRRIVSTKNERGYMDTFVNQVHIRRRRRKCSEEFKRDAVAACLAPGVSMAAVALANGLNANVLRRWVNEHETSKSIAFSPKPSDGTSAQPVTDGSATAKALDYSLKRWVALTRFIDDGQLPIDNNWIENQIRPIAIGRGNWLFAGSLRAGQRAAAVMSLIQSAKLNAHDPYAYLKDVLARLPTHKNNLIEELLPPRWTPLTL